MSCANNFSEGDDKTNAGEMKTEKSWLCATAIVWRNVVIMSALHLATLAVFVAAARGHIQLKTIAFFWCYAFWNAFGILAGAHRLWSHRSYKAHLSLRILLMTMQTASLQNSVFHWCQDHRVHHRYSETDADPHNSKRGLFFSHIGWLLCKKHADVKTFGRNINMQDLLADPVVSFQLRHFKLLAAIFWFILPVCTGVYLLGESLATCVLANCWRYVISLHNTWLVNSLAHVHGARPFNRHIEPRENKFVTYLSLGEGSHNYHHSIPWDYSASEFGWRSQYSLATAFIDFFAWLGLAYDLKVPSRALVAKKIEQTGGGDKLHPQRRPSALLDYLVGLATITWPVWSIAAAQTIFDSTEIV